jgi:predicted nucleotidyltransferase
MQASTDELLGTLRACLPSFSARYGVQRIGVFGSYARGEANDESDLDVLIEGGRYSLFDLVGMEDELSATLCLKVDLVSAEGLKARHKTAYYTGGCVCLRSMGLYESSITINTHLP